MLQADPLLAKGGTTQAHRYYDVCFVFPYKVRALVQWGDTEGARELTAPTDSERETMEKWTEERDRAFSALKQAGLVISAFYSRDRDEVFCKVGASGPKFQALAEQTRYPLQLKEQYSGAYCEYRKDYAGSPENRYTDRKILSSLYAQHPPPGAYPDETTVFRSVDRIRLLDYAIRSKDKGCAGLEIGELLKKGYLKEYYPLAEAAVVADLEANAAECFVTGEHLDKVRDYFGEKVGFYFLWMTYLNKGLFSASILGGVMWFVDSPLFTGTPNNLFAPVFCFFVILWLVAFMLMWKQRSNREAIRWGTLQRVEEVDHPRPEFHGTRRVSPLTGRPELYYPAHARLLSMATSYGILAVVMCAMTVLVLLLFTLRHLLNSTFPFYGRALFMFLLALSVEIVNMVFHSLATRLNKWENHRTDKDYEANLLAKTFVFKCGSTFGPLYYIVFLKRHSHLFGMSVDCMGGDCMVDLSCQLAMFMLVRLVFGNFMEWAMPKISIMITSLREHQDLRKLMSRTAGIVAIQDMSPAEQQHKRMVWETFDNLDEIVITYGLTVLFWVACPWAPIATFGTNVIECWGDAGALLRASKRPHPLRARDNEPWDTAFALITHLAVFTNIALVVFADTELDLSMRHKIFYFFFLEHVYFGVLIVLKSFFPPMPVEVRNLALKQAIIVKRHLEGAAAESESVLASTFATTAQEATVLDRDEDEDDQEIPAEGCSVM